MAHDAVAVVVGVGEGLGFAVARGFAAAGLNVGLAARNEERLRRLAAEIDAGGGRAFAWPVDARDEDQVTSMFAGIEKTHGPIEVVVYNAGAQYRAPFLEIAPEMFEKVWRLACFGGFLVGREAARTMAPRGHGTILFTGATASVRGGAEFAAFAAGKFGLRALAQSMARELGPAGIHVAHVGVDGLIDTPVIRERFAEEAARLPADGMLSPDAIGEAYVAIHAQPRSAWSFEIDLRPWAEGF